MDKNLFTFSIRGVGGRGATGRGKTDMGRKERKDIEREGERRRKGIVPRLLEHTPQFPYFICFLPYESGHRIFSPVPTD